MTRDVFIPRAGTPATPPAPTASAATPSAPVAQPPAAAGAATPPDPLVSAFPDWDLLPATQFVRRR